MIPQITPSTLISPKESRYFAILAFIATLVWLAIIVTLVGLLYVIPLVIFLWVANGLFVARLRAESVECAERQFGALYHTFREVCGKLQVQRMPRLFVLQADGALNAFATRHTGRDFVVVLSSMLESLGADSNEMRFVLGHEIGHVKRKHILKFMFLTPAYLIPLLPQAYRRAVESTCDRYGAFACDDLIAASRAITVLASGNESKHMAEPVLFAEQYQRERGFFVSWHELIWSYPTLSQRVYTLLALARETYPRRERRSALAYLCALLFCRQTVFAVFIVIYALVILRALGQKASAQAPAKSKASQVHSQNYLEEEESDYKDEP